MTRVMFCILSKVFPGIGVYSVGVYSVGVYSVCKGCIVCIRGV